jgi:hypothetical protein
MNLSVSTPSYSADLHSELNNLCASTEAIETDLFPL